MPCTSPDHSTHVFQVFFVFLAGEEWMLYSIWGWKVCPPGTKETQERAIYSPWWLRCRTQPRKERQHHSRCTGFTMPSWHREQLRLPQLLSIKQSWHFGTRQRRWLAALEVSVWPLSQHCLPSPGPLSPLWARAPNRPIVVLPGHLNGAIQGPCNKPLWRALPPPAPPCPRPKRSPVWVWGLAVATAAGSQCTHY